MSYIRNRKSEAIRQNTSKRYGFQSSTELYDHDAYGAKPQRWKCTTQTCTFMCDSTHRATERKSERERDRESEKKSARTKAKQSKSKIIAGELSPEYFESHIESNVENDMNMAQWGQGAHSFLLLLVLLYVCVVIFPYIYIFSLYVYVSFVLYKPLQRLLWEEFQTEANGKKFI